MGPHTGLGLAEPREPVPGVGEGITQWAGGAPGLQPLRGSWLMTGSWARTSEPSLHLPAEWLCAPGQCDVRRMPASVPLGPWATLGQLDLWGLGGAGDRVVEVSHMSTPHLHHHPQRNLWTLSLGRASPAGSAPRLSHTLLLGAVSTACRIALGEDSWRLPPGPYLVRAGTRGYSCPPPDLAPVL